MSRCCEVEDCNVKAFFNFAREKPGVRCGKHRIDGQINIYNKTCAFKNCIKRPLFNIEGENEALYCKKHKADDMIDVKNKKCSECSKRATHNYAGLKPNYCAKHATGEMEFLHKKKCKELGCETMAKYFYPNGPKTGVYCAKHKKETMIRI